MPRFFSWLLLLNFKSLGLCYSIINIDALVANEGNADDDAVEKCIGEISIALQEHGLFLVVVSSLGSEFFRSSLNDAKSLFNHTLSNKNLVKVHDGVPFRGYLGFGAESGLVDYFEPKEGYSYGYDWPKEVPRDNILQSENVWPPNCSPQFIKQMDAVFKTMTNIAQKIGTVLINDLNRGSKSSVDDSLEKELSPSILDGGDQISLMRLFHYFSDNFNDHPESLEKRRIGSSPHTDWGFLTVILQDGSGGLQYQYGGEWIDVAPVENSFVVNGGDFLSLLSGGRFRSPVHRVLCPPQERYSYVLFYYPNFNAAIPRTKKSSFARDKKEFNTLLSGDVQREFDHSDGNMSFGNYIIQKWREVLRY